MKRFLFLIFFSCFISTALNLPIPDNFLKKTAIKFAKTVTNHTLESPHVDISTKLAIGAGKA